MFIELEDTKNLLNLIYVCDCTNEDNVVIYTLTNGSIIREVLADSSKAQARVIAVKNTQAGGGGSGEDLSIELNTQDGALTSQEEKLIQLSNALDNKIALDLTSATSDATATAQDIVTGKTAYVNGVKLTGNYTATFKVPDGMKFSRSSVLPDSLDTSEVTDMGLMFNSASVTEIPQLDTSNVTNMINCFSDNTQLISLPQIDTHNVTNMQYLCNGDTALVNVPLLDLSSINEVAITNRYGNSLFLNCNSLSTESLNNILASLKTAIIHSNHRTLKYIGLSQTQAQTCQSLSNWDALEAIGWSSGY